MLLRFADIRDPGSLASRMRQRRMQLLTRVLEVSPDPARVLDVGGTAAFWRGHGARWPRRVQVTVLNRDPRVGREAADAAEAGPEVVFELGDARDLSAWPEGAFDVCFSNSVLEHVGSFDDQRHAAAEMRRVGRGYVVQTPNRYFPIEPHFHVPGWQFLPVELRVRLHQEFSLGWMAREPDPDRARADVEEIRLLDRAEMSALFPEATVVRESIGPLVKSLIAVYHPELRGLPDTI